MAIIENSVGEFAYLLTDFDQHSYESEDCFTRFMPKAKLDTAVRPIVTPSARKILLADDRIVTALQNDLDQAYVAGSLVEMLKQREAVHQLQGLAGDRQVPDARRALITAGRFFFNAQGLTLHTG